MLIILATTMSLVNIIECIDRQAIITEFPHSAFLNVICLDSATGTNVPWVCGASILNEKLTITAGHCLDGCNFDSIIVVSVGHAHSDKGLSSSMHSFLVHEDYEPDGPSYDIALVKLTTSLRYNEKIKRIAVMRHPPYFEKALVAGWGILNDIALVSRQGLKFIEQYVWPSKVCSQLVKMLPQGTFCASGSDTTYYASRGDSGSALVVRGYIQIGVVSFKMPGVSKSLVVYTDVGYFYEWIKKNSKRLYCDQL